MNTYKKSNVPLRDFIRFLENRGCKKIRTTGGHYIFSHPQISRSFPLQSHIDPVPQFIVLEIINYFHISSTKMWEEIKGIKGSHERKIKVARKGKRSGKKSKK